jgi:hypothetical protein
MLWTKMPATKVDSRSRAFIQRIWLDPDVLITMNGDMTSILVLDVMTLPRAESPFSAVTAIQPGGVFRDRNRNKLISHVSMKEHHSRGTYDPYG